MLSVVGYQLKVLNGDFRLDWDYQRPICKSMGLRTIHKNLKFSA